MSENLISYQTIYSNQIYLNSLQATTFLNGSKKSNLKFELKDVVTLDKNCIEVRLSLVSAQIPYSFYQINSTNNKIILYYLGTTTPYYIPYGNYNVNTFITQWNITLNNIITLTYSTITNTFTFSSTTANIFQLTDDVNSLFPVIGLAKGIFYLSTGSPFTAPYCYNFNGLTRINVLTTNVATRNIDSFNNAQCSAIASIPINCYPSGIILYNNFTNFKSVVAPSEMVSFGIELCDDNEKYIDFNNVDWTMTFQVDIVKEIILNKDSYEDFYEDVENNEM